MKRNTVSKREAKRRAMAEQAKAEAEARRQQRKEDRGTDSFSSRLAYGFFLRSLSGDE